MTQDPGQEEIVNPESPEGVLHHLDLLHRYDPTQPDHLATQAAALIRQLQDEVRELEALLEEKHAAWRDEQKGREAIALTNNMLRDNWHSAERDIRRLQAQIRGSEEV